MKVQLLSSLILGATLAMSAPIVMADTTTIASTGAIPMSKILTNLQEKGYAIVLKIELEDGSYKAKVIDSKGKELKINITPQTGEIIRPKAQTARLTMAEAVKKAEEAGYKNIYKVSSSSNEYELKGFDKDNKKVSVNVDATTGKINKEWF